eukprot:2509028-Amphidinium_carterae.1
MQRITLAASSGDTFNLQAPRASRGLWFVGLCMRRRQGCMHPGQVQQSRMATAGFQERIPDAANFCSSTKGHSGSHFVRRMPSCVPAML